MTFRPATLDDYALLMTWRLWDEVSNGYPKRTSVDDHERWLNERITNPLVQLLMWEENGSPAGMVRIDSNGELAFHAETDEIAHNMLTAVLPYAADRGGRLKATLDADDPKALQLERAGFDVYPSTFLVYRP